MNTKEWKIINNLGRSWISLRIISVFGFWSNLKNPFSWFPIIFSKIALPFYKVYVLSFCEEMSPFIYVQRVVVLFIILRISLRPLITRNSLLILSEILVHNLLYIWHPLQKNIWLWIRGQEKLRIVNDFILLWFAKSCIKVFSMLCSCLRSVSSKWSLKCDLRRTSFWAYFPV